jgi:hypothetical protein
MDVVKVYETYEAVYSDYLAELQALAPELAIWTAALEAERGVDENAKIWWTGVSGHPRVLAVYRKHYFMIEQLNVNRDAAYSWSEAPPDEEMWGKEDEQSGPGSRRHNDLLIADAAKESPELKALVEGISFVPIGLDQDDFPV